ncbi:MAG: bifunctional 3,4-dihydroxy-2-butanone-4-phosphate synthase/GTP cyclohydrolase II [Proteobacteria bacterium]|nr:bifunctional 3,4-dihydroxy-2-butanone-4-phosphate synthase/GTP cyclohydrolase II [Pseudomonadota bacterium]
MSTQFASIETALEDLRQGKMVILVDDEDRENEGDLVMAAEKVTPEAINFMAKYARGLICLPISKERLEKLKIPMMVEHNAAKYETAFTVSIEAAKGVTTGISAQDRARTVQVVADPNSEPHDIVMPGHIFPLRAREGGVLVRAGHTEGSVDLMKLAGLQPVAVICETMTDEGSAARLNDLIKFSEQHHIKIVSITDLIAYRMKHESLVDEVASTRLPLAPYGEFTAKVFTHKYDRSEHVALIRGEISPDKPCLVRVHSQCLTGDVFGSDRCDCGSQLDAAMKRISAEGGVLLYMSQEGRGIGLANKIRAYALQDTGLDTVDANLRLGFSADHRDYGVGTQILRHLGIRKMRVLTNNPKKMYGIEGYGIEVVSREPIETIPTKENISYLRTKREKMGHILNFEEK